MVKTSITPQQRDIFLSVPQNYVGKKLEILLYAVEELTEEPHKKNTMAQFWGKISDETAEDLHEQVNQSRKEWERNI
jgi:hypothetical protein